MILACARDLYGSDFKKRVLELNASDERGIAIVRNKIKTFAMVAVNAKTNAEGQSIPPYKLIVLDEADSMTVDAQSALRRTMETYCRITRFCIICNYISRLIPPITSRCAKFHFKPLPKAATLERLTMIAAAEGIACSEGVLELIEEQAEGDMRKAIQMMQSLHRLAMDGTIAEQAVLDISGAVPAATVQLLLATCQQPNGFKQIQTEVDALLLQGYPAGQLVSQLSSAVVVSCTYSDNAKARVSSVLAVADKNLVDGANEYLQLLNVFATICRTAGS
ncbi:P-loop containing nucleoside triphosphate hydrolase protein [Pavlovales sp. CCMP2436]|nr:P-loop containing nucleoside triphosphate hydrolase protein [Pavlovales sp. CCMP2436]